MICASRREYAIVFVFYSIAQRYATHAQISDTRAKIRGTYYFIFKYGIPIYVCVVFKYLTFCTRPIINVLNDYSK